MSDFLNWELTNRMHNLGYDGKTLMYIDDEEDIINDDSAELIGAKPAILTSAAFRWFREKHNIPFEIVCDNDYELGYIRGYYPKIAVDSKNKTEPVYQNKDCFETYEEAELACLNKLIELVEFKS